MAGSALRRWWVKAALQGALAAAPRANALDDRLRRARGAYLQQPYFLSKWHHVGSHLAALGNPGGQPLPPTTILEVGTGWFPIVPLGLALHGATVLTIDNGKHLDAPRVRLAMQMVSDLVATGEIQSGSPERVALLRDLLADPPPTAAELLAPLGIHLHIADAQDLSGLPEAEGADLLISNNTLEHIPVDVLAGIFREFSRLGAPDARMSHYIDLADHYAGFDPHITDFHFLTLSPRAWRWSNNRLGYQNRLQIGDYRRLLTDTGWQITNERLASRPRATLAGLDLVPPFDTTPTEELLVVKAHLEAARA